MTTINKRVDGLGNPVGVSINPRSGSKKEKEVTPLTEAFELKQAEILDLKLRELQRVSAIVSENEKLKKSLNEELKGILGPLGDTFWETPTGFHVSQTTGVTTFISAERLREKNVDPEIIAYATVTVKYPKFGWVKGEGNGE